MTFMFKENKGLFLINALLKIASSLSSVFFALILERLINVAMKGNLSDFLNILLFAAIYICICTLLGYVSSISQNFFVKNLMVALRAKYFSKLLNMDIANFNKVNSANYISNLSNDMSLIERDYIVNILNLIGEVATLTIATILMFRINIYVAVVTYLILFLLIVSPLLLNKKVQEKNIQYSAYYEKFISNIKDYFLGFEVIKGFNIEEKIVIKFHTSNMDVENKKKNLNNMNAMINSISNFLSFLVAFTGFGVGGYFVTRDIITIGTLIAIIQLTNSIFSPIIAISSRISSIKGVSIIFDKLKMIMDGVDNLSISKGIEKNGFESKIEYKNLYFSYDEGNYVLKNINLTFEKGKKYAIIGKSGSGKSTLFNLLLKYYSNFEGEILIDNINIREIRNKSLFSLISIIPQNIFIFNTSLKENITLYSSFSESRFLEAYKNAQLDNLTKDVNEVIQESGKNLSGGEKQRIAIARALIRRFPILVIDEGTSALDNITSYAINKELLELQEITVISITHKLDEDILRRYDQIIVMDDGMIAEVGNFHELVNNQSTFYEYLYKENL